MRVFLLCNRKNEKEKKLMVFFHSWHTVALGPISGLNRWAEQNGPRNEEEDEIIGPGKNLTQIHTDLVMAAPNPSATMAAAAASTPARAWWRAAAPASASTAAVSCFRVGAKSL